MTTQPTPARAPMTAQGAPILRPHQGTQLFRTRLEPQILRNTPPQVLRTTPSWTPPAPASPPMRMPAPAAAPAVPTPPVAQGIIPPGSAPPATAPVAPAVPPPAAAPAAESAPADGGPPLGPEEFVPVPGEMTFAQFVEGLNPLHHLPGVGTIYRAVTGAEIHPVMRVLGGGVLGGPIGMIIAAIGAAFDQTQPFERLGHTLAGRPDPHMPAPNSGPARAAAAYARFGGA